VVVGDDRLTELVAAHEAVFAGLLDATDGLDEGAWRTATGCPGWDVHDQLAHCIGIERLMLGDPLPDVALPDLPHVDDDLARVTELDVQARRAVPGDELRDEARETFDRRLTWLRRLEPGDLETEIDSPIGRTRAAKVLRTRVFDLTSHERDIRRALRRPAPDDGPHVRIAVEQVLRAWAGLLPGRLEAGVLRVRVPAHAAVTYDLAAATSDRADAGPVDATVTLSPDDVLAVGGGRDDAPAWAALTAEGDTDLLRRFVAAASVTP
jgi:uncharacterized protein (TIGR03083 family)